MSKGDYLNLDELKNDLGTANRKSAKKNLKLFPKKDAEKFYLRLKIFLATLILAI